MYRHTYSLLRLNARLYVTCGTVTVTLGGQKVTSLGLELATYYMNKVHMTYRVPGTKSTNIRGIV